ncbi:MAG: glycogen/starch synthase, partial [Oscillospiraceae bacterium]|nr:glycogen/starch synthase [Oscillospiraceae bacterium]
MRVLFAASEAEPFIKTGGLGDVGGSLPKALKKAGCEVRVILPKYSSIASQYTEKMTHIADFNLPLSWRNQYCGIEKLVYDEVTYYFVDN